MKKRLIAIVATVFAAMLVWSGASAGSQAIRGNDWELRPSSTVLAGGGNDWEFAPAGTSVRGNDWEFAPEATSVRGNDWE